MTAIRCPSDSMDEASLTVAARQLLKSRLRRHVFETQLVEDASDERIWRSMLALEDAIEETASVAWRSELSSVRLGDEALVRVIGQALYAAASSVLESLEGRLERELLERLVSEFVVSFQPSALFSVEALPC